MWSPQHTFDLWEKKFLMSWEEFIEFLLKEFIRELHHCLKINESFEHILNKVIQPFDISICACCSNVLACVVSHFVFHRTFPHLNFVILLFYFQQSTHALAYRSDLASDRAE